MTPHEHRCAARFFAEKLFLPTRTLLDHYIPTARLLIVFNPGNCRVGVYYNNLTPDGEIHHQFALPEHAFTVLLYFAETYSVLKDRKAVKYIPQGESNRFYDLVMTVSRKDKLKLLMS